MSSEISSSSSSASASASASSSSSSGRSLRKFDVFLSFRGEDTRKGFTDHLYNSLNRGGVHTFRDEEKLPRGKTIRPELLKAIKESRFAVVVLSENYASSTWCLDELAEIVTCKNLRGLTVFPIFCGVEPSEVRKQTGGFGKAFAHHEQLLQDMGKLNAWRNALIEVANVSGWDLKDRYESEVIKNIVQYITLILNRTSSRVNEELVGMDSRIKEVLSCLDLGRSDDVRTIGIWGMGGIGKTTLADEVFNSIKQQFEASCFIENVREESEKHGLVHLQKCLYNFLLESEAKIQNVNMGVSILKDRLCNMRVLIILDDVAKLEQIEKLAGKGGEQSSCFGPGSRIIVTTRDKKLLTKYGSNIYEVDKLTHNEALQLFCKKAFEKNQPADGYNEILKDVVKYASGLPLALEVLGSFLFGRTVEEWSSTLVRLRENPEEDIFGKLQVSVDGLGPTERKTFLDIACFFKGEEQIRVKRILEKCECFPDIDIKVLVEKSLITIVRDKLWMHDLLQELGWKIVRQESPEPGERSRLWLYKDAYDVLVQDKGSRAIEGLFLSLPKKQEAQLNVDPFTKMERLRLLKIRNLDFSSRLGYLSSELRFLEWHGCPLRSFPPDFQPDKLVELNMSGSCIGQFYWKDRPAKNLISIDLSDCQYLTKTPDFSNIPNLERLILKGCKRLSDLHQSVGVLKQLVMLNVKGCESLKKLPNEISLKSLKVLILSGCSKVKEFPQIKGNMEQLSELHLDGTAIVELPMSIGRLTGLTLLNLNDCKNLACLPSVICNLASLKTLNLSGCSKLDQLPEKLENLECLQELDVSETAIRREPPSISLLRNLEHLSFRGCQGVPHKSWLSVLSSCLLPRCFESINLQLSNSFSNNLLSLRSLDLSNCNLTQGAIPGNLGHLSSLQRLNLSGNNFLSLPDTIRQLSQLRELKLNRCNQLQSLPELPLSIRNVQACNCASLKENEFKIWVSNSAGFSFIICKNSDESNESSAIYNPPLQNIHAQPVLQKYYEGEINGGNDFQFVFIKDRIPDWAGNSSNGSSITIQLPPDLEGDSSWLGFALCFLLDIEEIKNSNCSAVHRAQFLCHFVSNQGCLEKPLMIQVSFCHDGVPSAVCEYIPRRWFAGQLNKASHITASIVSKIPIVVVTRCSAHLVYKHNAAEFVGDIMQLAFESTDLQEYLKIKDFLETPEASHRITVEKLESDEWERLHKTKELSNEAEFDSTYPVVIHLEEASTSMDKNLKVNQVQQEAELQSLLSRIFEGRHARHYNFGCVFPLIAILPWFTEQAMGKVVTCCLPSNSFDSNTWIGIDLYVVLSWGSFADDNLDSAFRSFLVVDLFTCKTAGIHREVVSIKKDSFAEPHRLVVVHVPRVHLPDECWKESLPISAMFRTTVADHVEIEMCGSRVVFEQDLKGLIKTLCDCTLQSPRVYYDRYYQTFANMEREILCGAETSEDNILEGEMPNDLAYCYRLQSRARQKTWEEFLTQKETREEFFIIECLLKDYYRGFDPKSIYNSCFPASDLPEWFSNHNSGYSVQIQLPRKLKSDSKWIGFALCAYFSSEEHQTASIENQDSNTSHCFVCHLETDKGSVKPLHAYQTPEEHLNWLRMGKFIWISYIPRGWFSDQLNECSVMEASFGYEGPSLVTQKCGLRLLYDDQEFDRVILQCMKAFGDYFHFLKQGFNQISPKISLDSLIPKRISRDPTSSFIILYIFAETAFHGSHSDSLVKWKQKLENYLRRFFEVPLTVILIYRGNMVSRLLAFDLDFGCNFYFPQKEIPDWFTNQISDISKASIPFSPNLYNDNNWRGYVICISFSVHDHPEAIYDETGFEMFFNIVCKFQLRPYCVIRSLRINKESIKWKLLRSFIWIVYAPRWLFKDFVNVQEGGNMEVCAWSDSAGLGIRSCGIRPLYQQDAEGFKQTIIQCLTSFFDDSDLIKRYVLDKEKRMDSGSYKQFVLDKIEELKKVVNNEQTSGASNYIGVNSNTEAKQSCSSPDIKDAVSFNEEEEQDIFLPFKDAVSSNEEEELDIFHPLNDAVFFNEEVTFEDICSTMIQGCGRDNLTVYLKRELHTLLSRIFKGCHARNYSFGCIFYPIFSRGGVGKCFTDLCLGRLVIVYPPPNLSDDKTWIGISLNVLLTWRPDVQLDNLGSEAPFLIVDFLTNDRTLLHTALFSLQRDSLVGSRRSLLFHVPRVCFPEQQMNKCQQIIALFSTNVPDLARIGWCGISLVYEQDLKSFVNAIAESTLATPGVYYSHYCQTFLNMERKIHSEAETCDGNTLEKEMPLDFGYFFCSQRDTKCLHKQEAEQEPASMQLIAGDSRFITSLTRIPTWNEYEALCCIFQRCSKGFDQKVIYNSCFPPSEIPEWFNLREAGPSVTIQLPKNSFDENSWVGLALWASFSVEMHSIGIFGNEDLDVSRYLICYLESDRGQLEPLHAYRAKKEELEWLCLGGFIWLSYIPSWWFSGKLNQCCLIKVSFGSEIPGLLVEKCGLRLLYEQGDQIQEFERIIRLCKSISWDNEVATSMKESSSTSKSGFTYIDIMAETLLYEHDDDSRMEWEGYLRGLLQVFFLSCNAQFTLSLGGHTISVLRGFDPCSAYFLCFPRKRIPGWFRNQSTGPKLKIKLHPNLHNVNYSLGFVICAAFSVHERSKVLVDDADSEKYVNLQCQFRIMNEDCVDCVLIPTLRLVKEEFTWKHFGGFIWLIYLPCNLYAKSLKQESSIEIEVSSDCRDLEVCECGIRLLNYQDVAEFKKTIEMLFTSFFDDLNPMRQFLRDKTCIKLCHFDKSEADETGSSSVDPTHGTNSLSENPQHLRKTRPVNQGESSGHSSHFPDKTENLDFSLDSIYNLCFPRTEILDWFWHHSDGPSLTIQIPLNLHSEVGNWMGLAVCAYYSELDPQHPTTLVENMDKETSHHLICHVQSEGIGLEYPHIYKTTNEEFKWLKHEGQFLWLSYIPRKSFSHHQLNQYSSLEVLFLSDSGSLHVHKCGLRLVYRHHAEELKQAIMKLRSSFLFENEDHLLVGSANSSKFDPQWKRLEGTNDPNIKDKGKRVLE